MIIPEVKATQFESAFFPNTTDLNCRTSIPCPFCHF